MNFKFFALCAFACLSASLSATEKEFTSPDGKVKVVVSDESGKPSYKVDYENVQMLVASPLGLSTNIGDYTQNLKMTDCELSDVNDTYQLRNIKQSTVNYQARQAICHFEQDGKKAIDVIFRVSNRDVAFCYKIYEKRVRNNQTLVCVVNGEESGFQFPQNTTTFLCPQSRPMGGFARTSPSYETSYTVDDAIGKNGWGEGYSFPCLFKVADDRWVLISETGVDGNYCASRLLNVNGALYKIGFPQDGECNGFGTTNASVHLPCQQ